MTHDARRFGRLSGRVFPERPETFQFLTRTVLFYTARTCQRSNQWTKAGRDVPSKRQQFGKALAAAREARGLSQSQLGEKLGGVVQSAVSAWELGKNEPDPATVFRMEEILECPPGHLSSFFGYLPMEARSALVHGFYPRTPEAIEHDPDLTDYERGLLLALYREIRAHPRRRRRE